MRINNKYIRNSAFRNKHWKRVRNQSHPYETFCPHSYCGQFGYQFHHNDTQLQIERHFDDINRKARALESGTHRQWVVFNASSDFRRQINGQRKARDRNIMQKIRNGDYDVEFIKYRKDAVWCYF